MNRRLYVLIPDERRSASKKPPGAVRLPRPNGFKDALKPRSALGTHVTGPLARLASLNAPTAEINRG